MAVYSTSRRKLHRLIWAKTMRAAAAEIGMSDVGLKKACVREGIPIPPQGYWNRIAAGHPPAIEPLRGGDRSFYLHLSDDPRHALPEEDYEELVRRLSAEASASSNLGPGSLEALRPIARQVRQNLARAKADDYGALVCQELTLPRVRVGPDSVDRAALLVDAIERLLDSHHWRLVPARPPYGKSAAISAEGYTGELSIEEPFTRSLHKLTPAEVEAKRLRNWATAPLYDYTPGGAFLLKVGHTITVKDRERQPVEERLHEVAAAIIRASFANREDERRERLQRERRERRQTRKAEIEQLRKAVSEASDRLDLDARAFRRTQRLRKYIKAAAALPGDAAKDRWLAWATAEASRLDPLLRAADQIFVVPDADLARLRNLEEEQAADV